MTIDVSASSPAFPDDPWSVVPAAAAADPEPEYAVARDRLWRETMAPRSIELALEVVPTLPPGRILVSPLGVHTDAIIDRLLDRPQVTVAGFVDRRGGAASPYRNLPAMTATEAARRDDYDYVLVSHHQREVQLVDGLLAAGIPDRKIRRLYTAREIFGIAADFARRMVEKTLGEERDRIEYFIVASHLQPLLGFDGLAAALPPDRTLLVHLGTPAEVPNDCPYRVFETHGGLAVLQCLVEACRPRGIYLSSHADWNFLSLIVRDLVPGGLLIHEIYDLQLLLSDTLILANSLGSPQRIADCRLGEWHSTQRADAVVTKRGGPHWAKMEARMTAQPVRYFQAIREPAFDPPARERAPGDPLRLVYAGVIAAKEEEEAYSFARVLPVIEEIATLKLVEFTLFNQLHAGPHLDARYAEYVNRFEGTNIRYNRKIGINTLLETLPQFDLGWMCLYSEVPSSKALRVGVIDRHVVLSARIAAYISAGLPVVVDDIMSFSAALVRDFDAGIVLDDPTPTALAAALETLDLPAKREGVRRLRRYLANHNQGSLGTLARLFQQARKR